MRSPPWPRPLRIAQVCAIDSTVRSLIAAQIIALRDAGYDVRCLCTPGNAREWLLDHGFHLVDVNIPRKISPLADLGAVWRMARYFRRERIAVVHTHTPKPGLIGQLAAWLAGVPVILNTWHGFYFHEHTPPLRRWFYQNIEHLAARFSSMILSQNPEDIETAVRLGIAPAERMTLLGNGVDLQRFDPRRFDAAHRAAWRNALNLPPDAVVAVIVARQVREKGFLELFEALAQVVATRPSVHLLIVGAPEPAKRDRIDPAAMSPFGIDPHVRRLGRRDDVPELLAAADFFVLPSWREGFPRSAIEAAAMGLPIITTNIRGCRQVVTHEVNGLLVPLRNTAALAEALRRLVDDPELRARLGQAGRQRALQEFDERRVCRIVLHTVESELVKAGLAATQDSPRMGIGR